MTTCPAETAKWEYLNGEMDRMESEAFARHLEGCPACRAELTGLERMVSEMRALPSPEPPAALVEAAKAAGAREASAEPDKRFRYSRRFNLAAGGALVLSVIVLTIVFPVRIPFESISSWLKIPSDFAISDSARDIIEKALAYLPLLLVPSILENIRFLRRRKPKNPPTHLKLFSI